MAEVYDGEWQLVKETPHERVWLMAVDDKNFVARRETLIHSQLAEDNAEHLKASDGKRWGDGQVAARIPLDIYFGKLGEAFRQGDKTYIHRFLNDPDNRWMRTFRGGL